MPAAVPFVDKSLGFELRLPMGWSYDRTGFFGPANSIGVLRGVAPRERTTLQILVFRDLRQAAFKDWVQAFAGTLGAINGVRRVGVMHEEKAGRPAAFLRVESLDGVERIETLYYCVQLDEGTIWTLSLATLLGRATDADMPAPAPAEAGVEMPEGFRGILNTLRIFYDPRRALELREALKRGQEYLAKLQLREDARKLQLDETVRWYQISLARKPIGYLTRKFSQQKQSLDDPRYGKTGKDGLRAGERSWRFADDGTARYSEIDLFSSIDGESDLYQIEEFAIPPEGSPSSAVVRSLDQCVREADVLFSSYRTSLDTGMPQPRRPIQLEGNYLGLAWVRVLPALLGPQAGPPIGFNIYDPETRALAAQSIRPLGRQELPDGNGQKAFAYELHDGQLEATPTLYTDEQGHMLRLDAGELVIQLSDQAAIEKQFGKQRTAAEARFKKGTPQPPKAP